LERRKLIGVHAHTQLNGFSLRKGAMRKKRKKVFFPRPMLDDF